MTEILIREQIEIERKRDEHARLDRINGVEKAIAILETRFDGFIEHIRANAVTDEDLEKLQAVLEEYVRNMNLEMREHFTGANKQQSTDMLGEVKSMFATFRAEQQTEQLETTQALLKAITERRSKVIWWVLGIIGAIIVSVASTLIVVWLIGRG